MTQEKRTSYASCLTHEYIFSIEKKSKITIKILNKV